MGSQRVADMTEWLSLSEILWHFFPWQVGVKFSILSFELGSVTYFTKRIILLRLLRVRYKTPFSLGLLACSLSFLEGANHHVKSLTFSHPHAFKKLTLTIWKVTWKERERCLAGPSWPSHLSSDTRHVTKGVPSWMFSSEFSDGFRSSLALQSQARTIQLSPITLCSHGKSVEYLYRPLSFRWFDLFQEVARIYEKTTLFPYVLNRNIYAELLSLLRKFKYKLVNP